MQPRNSDCDIKGFSTVAVESAMDSRGRKPTLTIRKSNIVSRSVKSGLFASLSECLRARIAREGPISLATYMEEALSAYYARGEAFGVDGDFITAPEISQMFGELIGLWAAVVWQGMGAPATLRLVELGPGRGTLMADFLRAAAGVPPFRAALDLHLVETSPSLRAAQRTALGVQAVTWHDHFDQVPDGPCLIIANEFFDALPIRQFERTVTGWCERRVGVRDGSFCFVLGEPLASPPLAEAVQDSPPGSIAEVCPSGIALSASIARRLVAEGGAALFVDYGTARSAPGDSLQAVRKHATHPPLEAPGEADLTAHVDFAALAAAAAQAGAWVNGPVGQGLWLQRLGITARAQALMTGKPPQQAARIASALQRLIGPEEMGTLFKVLALAAPSVPVLLGFEP